LGFSAIKAARRPASTLLLSSLRRIVHSINLRATGSLTVFCSSAACSVRPLRAAATASLTTAISAGGVESLPATAKRGAAACTRGVGVGPGAAFPDVLAGRGLGTGTVASAYARPASKRVPAATIAVMLRMEIALPTLSSRMPVFAMLFVRKIDEELTAS